MIFAVGNSSSVFGSFFLTLIPATMQQENKPNEKEFTSGDGKIEGNNLSIGLFGRRLKDKNWSDPLWVRQDDTVDLAY